MTKLRAKVQRHIVLFFLDGDSGDWFATACRAGVSDALRRRLRPGEELILDCQLSEATPADIKNTQR